MEEELEHETKIPRVQELRKRFQSPSASSAAPQKADPVRRMKTPHAETKGANKSIPESMQKAMEIRHFVKTVDEMENETGASSAAPQKADPVRRMKTPHAETKGANKSIPESMQKAMEIRHFVKTVDEMENETGASSAAPQKADPVRRMKTPHAETKGANKSIPESMQKAMEIRHFVKTVDEMENETGASSAAPQKADPVRRMKTPHAETKGANKSIPESMQKAMEIRHFVKTVDEMENETGASSAAPQKADPVRRMKTPHAETKGANKSIPESMQKAMEIRHFVKTVDEMENETGASSAAPQKADPVRRMKTPHAETKGANKSIPESMQKAMEIRHFVKTVDEMENETGASSAAPQKADPVRRMKTPHAETKGANKSIPESMQKAMEIRHFVKTVDEMENETELGTKIRSVQELIDFYQHLVAISEAPHLTVPGGKNMTPHAGRSMEINMRAQGELERNKREKPADLQSQLEVSQCAAPPPEELANNQASLQAISEKMQSLMTSLQNIEASRKQDALEIAAILRAEMQGKISNDLEAAKRSWSEENLLEIDNKPGRTVDRNTARALESMREEVERILTEKLAELQSQLEVLQRAAPPPEELANNQASLQAISEQIQSLMTSLQNVEASRKQDALEIAAILRAEMQGKISNDLEAAKRSWSEENLLKIDSEQGRTVDRNTARALESMREEVERILTEKLAELQSQLEVLQRAAPPPEELANNQASLQAISEKMQSLMTSLQNVEASRKQDALEIAAILRAEMQGKISNDLEAAKRSWSEENLLEIDNKPGRTVDRNTARALESMREEVERILTEKLAELQSQLEVLQRAAPPPEELANNQASLQAISEKMQSLMTSLQNVEASRKQDALEIAAILRAEMQGKISNDLEAAKRSWSEENLLEIDNKPGRTVDRNTARALESMREEVERILTEKLAELQSQLEVLQRAAPPPEELANNQASLQAISEQIQSLMTSLQNVEASRKQDALEIAAILRAEMQGKISNDLEAAKRSWSEENLLKIDSEQAEQQAPGRMQGDADMMESLKKENVDVTLDADTAHPRLQVSKDGKSVTDTGAIRRVPSKKERFDSHTFVLAKEGYASGRLYWEVDVGKRRNWILGVAKKTVTRKGTLVLSPQNGFWAIGVADGQDYWAYTDPWTRLTVGGKPRKIGIFLDISTKKLLFYNVHQKNALYIFSFHNDCRQEMKLFPFFSTGPTVTQVDIEPLQIAQGFDDDEK
ncbi:uncharacterized protein [Anas platyrhynchos]|uniref:uncharacterized protein isoform X2 n=1 Tax=Anas platyrhynchos TaxID=8839 RepID=UPI003AF2494C